MSEEAAFRPAVLDDEAIVGIFSFSLLLIEVECFAEVDYYHQQKTK
jgi:hypothetical protein